MTDAIALDPCCGSRMMWFDKADRDDPRVTAAVSILAAHRATQQAQASESLIALPPLPNPHEARHRPGPDVSDQALHRWSGQRHAPWGTGEVDRVFEVPQVWG